MTNERAQTQLLLVDLKPRYLQVLPNWSWHEIAFLCPRCRGHEISVAYHLGEPAHFPLGNKSVPTWKLESTAGFGDLTLTPSIDRTGLDKCGGWHGSITNGAIQ